VVSFRTVLAAFCVIASLAQAKADDKVVFATSSTSMLNLPVYVAEVMGYFGEQKIEPEIIVFKTGGATALAAVLGGNAHVYIGAPSSALGAASKGADAVMFGAIMTEVALNFVVQKQVAEKAGLTAESSDAERFKALKGLKIGVTGAGSATHQVAQYALRTAGLDPERDATIVFVNSSEDMRAAYSSKRVDAVITANPASDERVKEGSFLLFNGSNGGYPGLKGMVHIVLVGAGKRLAADPQRATRVLAAIKKAEIAIHDPALSSKARDLVYAKFFPELDRELFAAAWESVKPAIATEPALPGDTVTRNVEFLKEFSDQRYALEGRKLLTNDYQPK
jgi:NitT/TauT family transport system substrate-binding protein